MENIEQTKSIDLTKYYEESLHATKPNIKGNGRITMLYDFSNEDIEELLNRGGTVTKVAALTGCNTTYGVAVIDITQHDYVTYLEVVSVNWSKQATMSFIDMKYEESEIVWKNFCEAYGGEENLLDAIKNIQLGSEKVIEEKIRTPSDIVKPDKILAAFENYRDNINAFESEFCDTRNRDDYSR